MGIDPGTFTSRVERAVPLVHVVVPGERGGDVVLDQEGPHVRLELERDADVARVANFFAFVPLVRFNLLRPARPRAIVTRGIHPQTRLTPVGIDETRPVPCE